MNTPAVSACPWRPSLLLALLASVLPPIFAADGSVPPLVNYQGRLTDELGQPLPSGTYSVQFRIWPTTTGGTGLIWAREHEVTVVDGAFHVILGAPGGIAFAGTSAAANNLSLAFTEPERYLGITIVKGADGITVTNPKELAPRQQILSAPFALHAGTADVAASVLPASITSAALMAGSVQTTNLGAGVVTLPKLASRLVRMNLAGEGDIAFSQPSDPTRFALSSSEIPIPNLSVTLVTTGRPALVFLSSVEPSTPEAGPDSGVSYLDVLNEAFNASVILNVYRATTLISRNQLSWGVGSPGFGRPFVIRIPPSCIQLIDSPPAGTNRYSVTVSGVSPGVSIANVRLVALEL